jgi:ribonuclease PH
MTRPDARALDQLRPVTFLPGIAPHAAGSVLVSFGQTRVIVAATIEESVPPWMKYQNVSGGWLSAEYSMLPYSTLDRKRRDISSGKLDGRSSEIQRLIGRSLRAVVDLEALGQRTLWVDCDVLQADGGTRTAAITGASVAVALALQKLQAEGKVKKNPLRQLVAAVSAGVFEDTPILDLCYLEDKDAAADFNVVMTEKGEFVEMQGSGEEATFTHDQMTAMLGLAREGIARLIEVQRGAIAEAATPAAPEALAGLAALFGKPRG